MLTCNNEQSFLARRANPDALQREPLLLACWCKAVELEVWVGAKWGSLTHTWYVHDTCTVQLRILNSTRNETSGGTGRTEPPSMAGARVLEIETGRRMGCYEIKPFYA